MSAPVQMNVTDLWINDEQMTASAEELNSVDKSAKVVIFDDFIYNGAAGTEADRIWVLNSTSDLNDPAFAAAEGGVCTIDTSTTDNNGTSVVCAVPVQADSGGLVFETRLRNTTDVANVMICAGFTDSTALEEPASVSGTTVTTTASDAALFVYDSDMTTDAWWAVAVDGDTEDTGNGTCTTAPVADTYQTLRIEVDTTGAEIKFFINGTKVKTLAGAAGVSPDVNLYATVAVYNRSAATNSVDVDYMYVAHNRV